jgi:hypothetical protein
MLLKLRCDNDDARRQQLAIVTFGDGERGAPLVLQDVEADATFRRDVGVKNLGGKTDFGRLEWICVTMCQMLRGCRAIRVSWGGGAHNRWGTGW